MRNRRFKTAFVLGAGLGTRLRPLTDRSPKPLLPLGGRPIITYAMDHLISAGVDRFIVNTHYRPEAFLRAFPYGRWRNVPIIFRREPRLLDTGGGLKNIEDLLDGDDAIFCYNGDIVADLPLAKLVEAHEKARPEATLVLRSEGPLLNVSMNGKGDVCDLRNTLGDPGLQSCLFTGIYAVEKTILPFLEAGRAESIITALLRRIVERPGSVRGVVVDEGLWNDVGSREAYESLQATMSSSPRRGPT